MSTNALERQFARGHEQSERVTATAAVGRDPRRRALSLLAAGGLLLVAAATLGISVAGAPDPAPGRATAPAPEAAPAPAAADPEFPDVGVAANIYEPGHTSGWHTHPGVHSAVVLSGTLTVYDAACVRHDYGPGDVYLGGRDPHVARNDTSERVELVVTYVFPRVPAVDHATVVAPPAGCDVK